MAPASLTGSITPVHLNLNQGITSIMRSSNSGIQQTRESIQFDIYALSQHRQQASDIENQRPMQTGRPSQPVQVVASRQTALIYVRERPIRPPTPTIVVPRTPVRPASPAGSESAFSTEAKVLGGILVACVVIGAGAAAARHA